MTKELAFYKKAREGVVERFRERVQQAIDRVERHPASGAPSPDGTRSIRVRDFPFDVVYWISTDHLLIVALSPHRRRPGYWRSRLPQPDQLL